LLEANYLPAIERAAEDFSDHEKMTSARVLRWFRQFAVDDYAVASRVLESVDYYGASRIRGMTKQLVEIVLQVVMPARSECVYFVPVGGVYRGSRIGARALSEVKRQSRASWRICSMAEVERLEASEVQTIVFVDDFSGTGETLVQWWREIEPLVLPRESTVIVALLVMNERARDEILRFADEVVCVNELDASCNALSPESKCFCQTEQETLHRLCAATGATPKYVKGRGECGLLVAFRHGCPNNSLPVLWWWESDEWTPLFQRHGL